MIDWNLVETNWRHTDKSNRLIARECGVSEGAIRKRAKAERWEKGIAVTKRQAPPKRPPDKETQIAIHGIAEAGQPLDKVVHLAERMLDELDATTMLRDEIDDLINVETADDRDPTRRNAMLKAVSLPSRAMTLKTLTQAMSVALQGAKPEGKKEQRKEEAKNVASGRFAPPAAPKLVVNNG